MKTQTHDSLARSALALFEELRDEYDFKMRVAGDAVEASRSVINGPFLSKTLSFMHSGE